MRENDKLRELLRQSASVIRWACENESYPAWDLLREVDAAVAAKPVVGGAGDRGVLLQIVGLAADIFGVTVRDVLGGDRSRKVVRPRQVAMYVARKRTGMSFPQLGEAFGRDHSTVQYAVRQVNASLTRCREGRLLTLPGDDDVRDAVDSIQNVLTRDHLRASAGVGKRVL